MLCYLDGDNLVVAELKPKKRYKNKFKMLEDKAVYGFCGSAHEEIEGFDKNFFDFVYKKEVDDTYQYNSFDEAQHFFPQKNGHSLYGFVFDKNNLSYYGTSSEISSYGRIVVFYQMLAKYPTISKIFLSRPNNHYHNMTAINEHMAMKKASENFPLAVDLTNMLIDKDNKKSIKLLEACFDVADEEYTKILLNNTLEEFTIFYYDVLPIVDLYIKKTYDLNKMDKYSDSLKHDIKKIMNVAKGNSKVLNIINYK